MLTQVNARYLDSVSGGQLRYALFDVAEPKGAVMLLPGRTEFIEKYALVIEGWQNRGYSVIVKDWRNQGLSTRPLTNRHKHHVADFNVMLDDLEQLLAALAPELGGLPLLLFGHSMGGHLGLRFLAEREHAFIAAMFSAPMVDIQYGMPAGVAKTLALCGCGIGAAEAYVPGQTDAKTGQAREKFAATLTSDRAVLEQEWAFLDENPDHALGGITFGWLKAAIASINQLNQPKEAEAITIPVLVGQAGKEALVDNKAMTQLVARLPKGELAVIDGAQHEIWREAEPMRNQFWAAIDDFLARV